MNCSNYTSKLFNPSAATLHHEIPLEGATILLKNSKDRMTTVSNTTGQFSFEAVTTGEHTIMVSAIGFETYSRTISIAKSQRIDLLCYLYHSNNSTS